MSTRGTRTYYSGSDAEVTDAHFTWHASAESLSFAISELRHVGLVQSPARTRPYAPHLAAGALLTVAAGWALLADPTLYVIAFMAVSGPLLAFFWREPRRWELHAQYHGTAVVLYSSGDVRVFNQVGRALRRAMEDGRRTPWGYGLAAA
ncbi:DUF6232 family protein [Actinoplanes regularis]|uniref:Uncharacterized protein n=1 Tax=Actinoplanes regularis TaxID=52697 RepID=A0A239CGF1_9ACTN|nr:DUF6232 family protein [Actinoplanes regularis]GIE89391.1 hypothetical protein Are01nite_58710 [Actinoplanes regularis]GLW32064.1 hypothetical protein Areg01_50030 [Actinoplanes regularis]SNS19306.1 hypothetical protein SAMN06264365_111177 [Actinoplanes regularis]